MARVLLGVSGGIAASKAVEFVRLATGAGHSVRVVMTPSARRFVGTETFEGITGAPVLTSEFEDDPMRGRFPGEPPASHDPIGHLELAERADAFLVAPASANTIAKLASGQADSMLTTSFLACSGPRLVAPAMNDRMLADPATRSNLDALKERGITVIEPETGRLASAGEYGKGRLPDPEVLLSRLEAALSGAGMNGRSDSLSGVKVLVTAGGTREPIDGVRFIGNRSSGRMGRALASVAASRGAEVTLIEANPNTDPPPGVEREAVETTSERGEALRRKFDSTDLLLMAAAPADFRPVETVEGKLSRGSDGRELELEPTEDLLAEVSDSRRTDQFVVGFAAEWGSEEEARAREKLRSKGVDMVVLNDVSDPEIGFDSERNEVILVTEGDAERIPRGPKEEVAGAILDRVVEARAGNDRV
ncbi:MAG: bifunctional phosphopantothenoylcysteine decarboxylase/phosphopantothenate--cysteine ligase CoaBC [Solirubrobacterales bacterium]